MPVGPPIAFLGTADPAMATCLVEADISRMRERKCPQRVSGALPIRKEHPEMVGESIVQGFLIGQHREAPRQLHQKGSRPTSAPSLISDFAIAIRIGRPFASSSPRKSFIASAWTDESFLSCVSSPPRRAALAVSPSSPNHRGHDPPPLRAAVAWRESAS